MTDNSNIWRDGVLFFTIKHLLNIVPIRLHQWVHCAIQLPQLVNTINILKIWSDCCCGRGGGGSCGSRGSRGDSGSRSDSGNRSGTDVGNYISLGSIERWYGLILDFIDHINKWQHLPSLHVIH